MGRKKNSIERMLDRDVEKTSTCWLWKGPLAMNGYGKTQINRVRYSPHRLFYEHFKGPIPDGQWVMATCKNKACVNPQHLEALSPGDCIAEGESPAGVNGRKTHCLHGHPLTGANLYVTPDGRRQCKTCRACAGSKRQGERLA